MEHTLGDTTSDEKGNFLSLNPCFNGTYSRRDLLLLP